MNHQGSKPGSPENLRCGRVLADALPPLRQHLRGLLLFHLWFGGLSALVLTPGLAWLVDWLAGPGREAAVTNEDLVGYLLSPFGAAWLALTAATAAALLHFAQIGACTLLLGRAGGSVWTALAAGLRRLPLLVRMSLRQFALILPVVALAAGWLLLIKVGLLGDHDINYYLHQQPPAWWWAVGLAGVVALSHGGFLLWVVARWLFAVPLLAGGRVQSDREALSMSWRLTRGQGRRLLPPLIGGWAGLTLVSGVAAGLVHFIAGALLDRAGTQVAWVLVIVAATLLALAGLGLLTAALGTSLHAAISLELLEALAVSDPARAAASGTERRSDLVEPPVWSADVPSVRETAPWPWLTGRRVWLLLLVLWGVVVVGLGLWMSRLDFQDNVAVTAHRGSSKRAPENTLVALRQAVADGADYVEIDVQTTRDGQVVLLHDGDFMRLAGDPRKLADLTLAEARTIDVGRQFGAAFAGEHVPTLAAAIGVVRGHARLNIELKFNRPDPNLAPAVLAVLAAEQFADQCVLTSLDGAALAEVRRRDPKLRLGLIVAKSIGDITRLDVDFLSVNTGALTPALLRSAHRAGQQVHVWTVNSEGDIHRMLDLGVDNLITDYPERVRRILTERAALNPAERLALRLRGLIQD